MERTNPSNENLEVGTFRRLVTLIALTGVQPGSLLPIADSGYCLMAEEDSPAIHVVSCSPETANCGVVHASYVPEGTQLARSSAYAVHATLPKQTASTECSRCAC